MTPRNYSPIFCAVLFSLLWVFSAHAAMSDRLHVFATLPSDGPVQTPCLPTPNPRISEDSGYAAKTRVNDDYGMPGWTRSQGGRFHKGVDILPVNFVKTDQTVRIEYYDPKTQKSFSKNEPVLVPKDEVYAILDGTVVVTNTDETRSGYGRYIMLESKFKDGAPFISMYAHLKQVDVKVGDTVNRGDQIAWMGQTSSDPGGRNYLKAIPHCHFEIGKVIDTNFASTLFAKNLFPRIIGSKFDPRNIQPFHPINFLQKYQAKPRSTTAAAVTQDTLISKSDH